MYIFRLSLMVAIIALLTLSCSQQSTETNSEKSTTESVEEETSETSEKIELENGQKWTVNAEMKPFILEAEEVLKNYIASNETDHVQLADQLKEQNSQLIKSCTMKGQSHDELHKWLHPHIKLIYALGKTEDRQKANEIISQLQTSFETYHKYFQ